jgi:hypothetical protein
VWAILLGAALAAAVVRVARRSKRRGIQSPARTGVPGVEQSKPAAAAPEAPAPAVATTAATDASRREAWLRTHVVGIAEDTFPDDLGLDWVVQGFEHRGPLTLVEVEPRPATVGYPRFRFAVSFAGSEPRCLATYAAKNGRFELLCSLPGRGETLPRVLV